MLIVLREISRSLRLEQKLQNVHSWWDLRSNAKRYRETPGIATRSGHKRRSLCLAIAAL